MKRASAFLVFAVLFAESACFAGGGLEAGAYWNAIDEKWGPASSAVKSAYLLGILEGFHFMIDRADVPEGAPVFEREDVGAVSSALDRFYSDPRNARIPIVYALSIVRMRMRGVDAKTMEKVIEEKRGFWNSGRAAGGAVD